MPSTRPPRSGCAVLFGVFLIGFGSLALAQQLLGFMGLSPIRVGARVLDGFGTYWPLLLVAWGIYKVYIRFNRPERAHVSAAEIVILVWILVAGLAVRGARSAMEELSVHVSADDVASVFGADLLGPPHRVVEQASFDLGDATALVVKNVRGQVAIVGTDDTGLEVTLTKQMHSFSESDATRALSRVELDFRVGDEAEATLETSARGQAPSLVTDLEIRVPRRLSVTITNRRGAIRVENVDGATTLATAHASVEASNLAGGVKARTSHGTLRLERISGPVVAANEHGPVRAAGVDGDVSAKTEHSSITVEDVTGNATLETEHGTVRATAVAGDIEIESPYSEVSVENAGQAVRIVSSHRPVFVHDVGGGLEVVARYARIVVRGVTEDVSIDNVNRPVSVSGVGRSVSVSGDKCSVDVDDVRGPVTIATSDDDVRVSEFSSSLDVRTSNADVEVRASAVAGALRVETTRGDVSLALPSDVSARVSARCRRGELVSEFDALVPSGGDSELGQWEGSLGSGAHPLTIVTHYGDIALRRTPSK